MTTVIVGGGSLGLLLTDASMSIGERPYLLVRRKEQMQQLQQEGLTVVEEGRVRSVRHLFDVSTDWPKEVSRIIVATKFDAIQELLPQLERINAPTLFIQNGLAHYERIQKSHLKNVTFASIEHGAARLTDASVSHNGIGRLVFPKEASSHTWGDYMTSSVEHYPVVQVDEDALTILKRKVFMNVLINPLTAIYEIRNGVLVEEDIYYEKSYRVSLTKLNNSFHLKRSSSCVSKRQTIILRCIKTDKIKRKMKSQRSLRHLLTKRIVKEKNFRF